MTDLDALEARLRTISQAHSIYLEAADAITELRADLKGDRDAYTIQSDSLRYELATHLAVHLGVVRDNIALRSANEQLERAGEALAKAARSLAGDIGTHQDAWIWDKLDEWDAALGKDLSDRQQLGEDK